MVLATPSLYGLVERLRLLSEKIQGSWVWKVIFEVAIVIPWGCRKIWLPPHRGISSNCTMDLPGGAECSLALALRAREFLQPLFSRDIWMGYEQALGAPSV
jgi:hypothetical protein